MSPHPKVILSAYQCAPGWGSVSQIGWEWYSRLSRRIPVLLVTPTRNKNVLTKAGAPLSGSEVIYVDTEWFARPLFKLASRIFKKSQHAVSLVMGLDFFLYDRVAKKLVKKRISRGDEWSAIHVVTPITTSTPTCLHELGLPIIRGPLNCGMEWPRGFLEVQKQDSGWVYPLRYVGRFIDWVVGSTRNSTVLLTANERTLRTVPLRYRSRCIKMMENGVDFNRFKASPWPDPPSNRNPLKILFVGRLAPFKGLPMLLEAISTVSKEFPIQVSVAGAGPMEEDWKRKTLTLGLENIVRFYNEVTLDEVANHMRSAHVFCLPSVRESGGSVLLEAMASARPVIAVAWGGPAETVDDEVGRAIPANGYRSVVKGLVDAFKDVARHPASWMERGKKARRRAEQCFGWDIKIDQAIDLYNRIGR